MQIGKLAKTTGVPVSTIRYYERAGLIDAPSRSDGNYRIYSQDAVERLRFIRASQAMGFTLEDIATLLKLHDGEDHLCDQVQEIITARLADVEARAKELRTTKRALSSYLNRCKSSGGDHCELLNELVHAASGE